MPRSSRHKSSKHGSREARECSDSERDSGMKDHRKGKDESVAGKGPRDSGLSEKRKLNSRSGTGNEEHSDEYSSSKRRRERGGNGGGAERRNVGGNDERREAAKKAGPGDSKSRRRDESGEEVKKHRDSGRKESREGRRRRSLDKEESGVHDDYIDLRKVDELQSPELDDQLERKMKKRDSGDADKHQDDVGDGYNRRFSSRDEIAKDRRQKDGKRKDEKYRDKYTEEMDREIKHQHAKQQEEHYAKDHISIKFNDKHAREEKDSLEFQQKRTKLPKSDRDRDHNHDRNCDLESGRAHERHYERVHSHDYERDQTRDFDRDNDHDRDCDGSHVDDRSARSKDSGTKKTTLYGYDDYTDTKSRVVKGQYHDREKKSLSSGRVDSDVDRGRSQPRQAHIDSTGTSNKRRSSPASNTHIVKDEYRNANSDERLVWELTQEKPLLDEPPQVESSFYDGTCQGNASLIPAPPAFRAALDRRFVGSIEDDVRDNSNTRNRRSSDPGFGRGHGNSWRAVPSWTSPSPDGFVSFQPGPAHRGFPTMMPQFTSQPLFGVRPSMEVNHAGIPYHITDADRFPGHLRPLGWQNVMDGTGPPLLHGWESNNGVFRDDPHVYGRSDWDQKRHSTNSYGWESGSETWKEQHGDSKKDLPSPACKDESIPVQLDDNLTDQAIQVSQDDEHNQDIHEKSPESSHPNSLSKLPLNSLSALEKVPGPSTPSDNTAFFSRFYLSKLDISADLVITELYDQCMCLVNVDKNASIDADASAKLFQKNVSGAQKIYTATFSRHSPLPAIDNSIFQRAIDIYKKQKVELPNGGQVDIISASNQVQVDESVPIPSLGSRQVSASASNGTEDLPMSTLGDKKLEALSPAKEHLEEIDQTCNQKGLDHDCTHSSKLVMSSPSSGHEKQIEPVVGLRENKVNSGDAEENFKNESQLAPPLGDDGDNMNSKAKTTGFAHHADEKQGFGDTLVSPLIFEDGSPRACDTLMPGSNESESLMLNRIHHSPESTH